jgi:hypothetical protein
VCATRQVFYIAMLERFGKNQHQCMVHKCTNCGKMVQELLTLVLFCFNGPAPSL